LRQKEVQVKVEAFVPKLLTPKTATCIGGMCRHRSYTIIKAPSKQVRARLLLKPRLDSFSFDAFDAWLSALKRRLFPCAPTCILPEGQFVGCWQDLFRPNTIPGNVILCCQRRVQRLQRVAYASLFVGATGATSVATKPILWTGHK